MSQQHPRAPLGATASDPSPFAAVCRAFAIGGIVAALAACAERAEPTAPQAAPAVAAALTPAGTASASDLSADAIDRILPALERDAAAAVGNALAALDAMLRDARATPVAKDRAAAAAQNVLAQFADPARADAADLDAMRLEVDDIRASLK